MWIVKAVARLLQLRWDCWSYIVAAELLHLIVGAVLLHPIVAAELLLLRLIDSCTLLHPIVTAVCYS